jgi:hypothetical protein
MSNSRKDSRDRIRCALNERKRQELTEKYGAKFSPETHPKLTPELEAQWLDNIEEFERQFENAQQVPVRDIIGSPSFKPLADISPGDLEAELDLALDQLAEHGIVVDFLYDVDPAEAYRFIVEELLDEEVEDICIPGMACHFIYEYFHPNQVENAKMWAEEFLIAFLSNNNERLIDRAEKEELLDSQDVSVTDARLRECLKGFHASQGVVFHYNVEAQRCEVEGDFATVELAVSWDSETQKGKKNNTTTAEATLRLKRSPYDGWEVIQVRFPPGKL